MRDHFHIGGRGPSLKSDGQHLLVRNATDTAYAMVTALTFRLPDMDSSHELGLHVAEAMSADRTLTIATNDANRTLTIAGDATINGTNTGDALFDGLSAPAQADVSVTGAVTLSSTARGRMHAVTGASDYTITLVAASTAGFKIGFSFRQNAGVLVRLTGVAMGGKADMYFIAGESLVLRSNGSTYDVESYGECRPWLEATRTTDQTLTDETHTTAEYGTETYDAYGLYNNATYVGTANRPGRWQIAHYLLLRATTINFGVAGIRINTTSGSPTTSLANAKVTAGGEDSMRIPLVRERICVKGDTFQPTAYLDGVTGLKIDGPSGYSMFGMRWIGHE